MLLDLWDYCQFFFRRFQVQQLAEATRNFFSILLNFPEKSKLYTTLLCVIQNSTGSIIKIMIEVLHGLYWQDFSGR